MRGNSEQSTRTEPCIRGRRRILLALKLGVVFLRRIHFHGDALMGVPSVVIRPAISVAHRISASRMLSSLISRQVAY